LFSQSPGMRMNALDLEPDNAGDFGSAVAPSGRAVLQLSGVSKNYASIAALSDVSVEFFAGEVQAVLGENGAGKSTLMSIISGVNQPDTGAIEFEGASVSPMTP